MNSITIDYWYPRKQLLINDVINNTFSSLKIITLFCADYHSRESGCAIAKVVECKNSSIYGQLFSIYAWARHKITLRGDSSHTSHLFPLLSPWQKSICFRQWWCLCLSFFCLFVFLLATILKIPWVDCNDIIWRVWDGKRNKWLEWSGTRWCLHNRKYSHYSTNYKQILVKFSRQLCKDTRDNWLFFCVIWIVMLTLQIRQPSNLAALIKEIWTLWVLLLSM